MENVQNQISEVAALVIGAVASYGLSILGGILLLIVGWTIAGWAQRTTDRTLGRIDRLDVTLRRFLASLVRYVILVLTGLAVLSALGVQTASLIAVFGAAGLAIGLALQGTLSNVAAGVMLLLFRPFNVGQYVQVGGNAGTVKAIGLFITELATPDNVQILVPNAQVWGTAVTNYSHHTTRRVDFAIGIDYGDDIGQAFQVIRGIIAAEPRCHGEPEPLVAVGALADSSVNLIVRIWCDASDYWGLKCDLTRTFKEGLEGAGLSIPFPQRTVHISGPAAPV